MKMVFWLGFFGLLLFEIANVYFIMPMPGSQQNHTIDIAYFIAKNNLWLRLTGVVFFMVPAITIFRNGTN